MLLLHERFGSNVRKPSDGTFKLLRLSRAMPIDRHAFLDTQMNPGRITASGIFFENRFEGYCYNKRS